MNQKTKEWFFKSALRKVKFLKKKNKYCNYQSKYLKNDLAVYHWLIGEAKRNNPELQLVEDDFFGKYKEN